MGWVPCNTYNRAKYRCTLTIVQKVILCKFDGYKNGTYYVIYANLLSIYVASRLYYINVSFFLHLISVSFYAIIVNEMLSYIASQFVVAICDSTAISIQTKICIQKTCNCWPIKIAVWLTSFESVWYRDFDLISYESWHWGRMRVHSWNHIFK